MRTVPLLPARVWCDQQRTRPAAELYELRRLKCGERFACLCLKDLLLGTAMASGRRLQKHEMPTFDIPPSAWFEVAAELNDAKKCSCGIVSQVFRGLKEFAMQSFYRRHYAFAHRATISVVSCDCYPVKTLATGGKVRRISRSSN
jgi:hypothetical protein